MERKTYTNSYFSRDYFSNLMLPIHAEVGTRNAAYPIPFTQHDDLILMYIVQGEGKLIVNAKEYEVERGLFLCMSPFHYYMLEPKKGSPIKTYECKFTVGASLYISACPYNDQKVLNMPYAPASANLDEADCLRVEAAMRRIEALGTKNLSDKSSESFLLLMKLYGILLRNRNTNEKT